MIKMSFYCIMYVIVVVYIVVLCICYYYYEVWNTGRLIPSSVIIRRIIRSAACRVEHRGMHWISLASKKLPPCVIFVILRLIHFRVGIVEYSMAREGETNSDKSCCLDDEKQILTFKTGRLVLISEGVLWLAFIRERGFLKLSGCVRLSNEITS